MPVRFRCERPLDHSEKLSNEFRLRALAFLAREIVFAIEIVILTAFLGAGRCLRKQRFHESCKWKVFEAMSGRS